MRLFQRRSLSLLSLRKVGIPIVCHPVITACETLRLCLVQAGADGSHWVLEEDYIGAESTGLRGKLAPHDL